MRHLFALYLIIVASTSLLAQPYALHGKIFFPNGKPANGMAVTYDKWIAHATPDGEFFFPDSSTIGFITVDFPPRDTFPIPTDTNYMEIHLPASEYFINKQTVDSLKQSIISIELGGNTTSTGMPIRLSRLTSMQVKERRSLPPSAGKVYMSVISDDISLQEHHTENYTIIRDNRLHSPLKAPLSTFSIDVDQASYANMRRYITDAMMPPPDALRIEELINYFDYDYEPPQDEAPFAVHSQLSQCPWNPQRELLRIALKGKELKTEEMVPNNLVFLIDVSGSMQSANKLRLLQKSLRYMVRQLRPEDKVGIVVYSGAAGVVLEPTSGAHQDSIKAVLNSLTAGGSTAGGEGIKRAYELAREHFVEGGNNRVILATDGDFNVGVSSDAAMVRLIEAERKSGIFLTVLGVGTGNYKGGKMEEVSNAGNGNYYYLDNLLEGKRVLGQELWGTIYTIARDVKIQVEFNPAQVKAYRLVGYYNRQLDDEDFNDDKKDAGEIGAGHTVTVFYEIVPPHSDEPIEEALAIDELNYQQPQVKESDELLTLKLRYKPLDKQKSKLMKFPLKRADIATEQPDSDFQFASAVAELGLLMRRSEHKAQASFDALIQRAQQHLGEDPHGTRAEFVGLAKKARLMFEEE